MYLLGYDVGGTKIEAALVEVSEFQSKTYAPDIAGVHRISGSDKSVRVLGRMRVPTERLKGYEHIVTQAVRVGRELCQEMGVSLSTVNGVGFALPGAIEPLSQMMLSGNTMALIGKPFAADVMKGLEISCRVFAENDANCFALAEALCGAGRLHFEKSGISSLKQVSVGLILGTGCGGGIIINGRTLRGKRGGAGEIGHVELYTGGTPCYCGRRGCAEQYLSGTALESAMSARLYSQITVRPSARDIFELAANLDPVAVAIIKNYVQDLGRFLGNLTNLFDPDFFVLGGGLSLQPLIYQGLEDAITRNSFLPGTSPRVYQHVLGDSAGVLGAALLSID